MSDKKIDAVARVRQERKEFARNFYKQNAEKYREQQNKKVAISAFRVKKKNVTK